MRHTRNEHDILVSYRTEASRTYLKDNVHPTLCSFRNNTVVTGVVVFCQHPATHGLAHLLGSCNSDLHRLTMPVHTGGTWEALFTNPHNENRRD
jgi:hypothetical protein